MIAAEIVDLDWLNRRAEAWDRLVAEAPVAMPFYGRHVVNAHARHGLSDRPGFLAVRCADRLVGLLPYRAGAARFGWLGRANAAWHSPFTTATTPLVAGDAIGPVIGALLDGMAAVPGRLWVFAELGLDDAVGTALRASLAERLWPATIVARQERAVFDRRPDEAAYRAALGAGRRKDLRRRRRRLAELGEVRLATATAGPDLASAIDAFLAIEAGGWKGRRGTALGSRPATADFARALFSAETGPVRARADLLVLGGKPIAASLTLLCNGTAFLLKSAYDESFARYAPGVILEDEIVGAFRADGFAQRLNSAGAPGGVLERLYPDRESVGDLVMMTQPAPRPGMLAGLGRSEMRRRALMRHMKDLYWRVKERV